MNDDSQAQSDLAQSHSAPSASAPLDSGHSESAASGAENAAGQRGSSGRAPSISTASSQSFQMVRRISWRELFPWLILFRSFPIAFSPSVILLATIALLVTPVGWFISDVVFVGDTMASSVPGLESTVERNRSPYRRLDGNFDEFESISNWLPFNSGGFLRGIHRDFSEPYWSSIELVDADHLDQQATLDAGEEPRSNAYGLRRFAYYIFGALWTLAIWALFGGAITRIAVVRLGRNERVGLKEAIVFACRRYLSLLSAPLMPLTVVLLFILLMAIPGLAMRVSAGAFVVSLAWGILLLGSVLITLLLFVLVFCWPLMFPAIGAEGSDAFDSVSRSYTYVYQRPLQYFFYATLAVFMMGFGGILMLLFSESVLSVTRWGVSWGAGEQVVLDYTTGFEATEETGSLVKGTYNVIGFWESTARTIGVGYLYGLFWCIASAVYLVLRRSVDETEVDQIFVDGDDQTDPLPALKSAAGPEATDPAKTNTAATNTAATNTAATNSPASNTDPNPETEAPANPASQTLIAPDSTARSETTAGDGEEGNTPVKLGDFDASKTQLGNASPTVLENRNVNPSEPESDGGKQKDE